MSGEGKQVVVTLELPPLQAEALAQFVKRVGWHEFRQNAVDDDEAYEISAAVAALQKALADAGYAPR
jgi:hypothetical protein